MSGKCNDPESDLTACSGGETWLLMSVPTPIFLNHDCKIDPDDKKKALCSSSGTISTAIFECQGHEEDDLRLIATLDADAATVTCGAEGASAKQKMCK